MNVTAYIMGDPPPGRSALERREQPRRITLPGKGGGKPRLNEHIVRIVRESTERYAVLAARYGVTKSAIKDIRIGRTWTHVK